MAELSSRGRISWACPALALTLVLGGCGPKLTEVIRASNPDDTLDAVDVIRETGATVGFVTEVHIVPHGRKAGGKAVFRADNVDGLTMTWTDPLTLEIGAELARPFLQESVKRTKAGEVNVVYKLKPFVFPTYPDE